MNKINLKGKLLFIFLICIAINIISFIWALLLRGELTKSIFFSVSLLPFLFIYSFIAFSILAFIVFIFFRNTKNIAQIEYLIGVVGATLALISFTINIHVKFLLIHDAQGAFLFLVYIPYAIGVILGGYVVGMIIGSIMKASNEKKHYHISIAIFITSVVSFIIWNVFLTDFGRFGLLPPNGIKLQKLNLYKKIFYTASDIGYINSIDLKDCTPLIENEIVFTGSAGAVYLSQNKEQRSIVNFSEVNYEIYPIDIENDGKCEFLANFYYSRKLVDEHGNTLWAKNDFDDILAFDINGDKNLELIISDRLIYEKSVAWDKSGTKIKSLSENLSYSKSADIDGDGINELITFSNGQLTIFDSNMRQKRKFTIHNEDTGNNKFKLLRWPDSNGEWSILIIQYSNETTIQVHSLVDGRKLSTFKFKIKIDDDTAILPVKFIKNAQPFLVVYDHKRDGSILLVYDWDNKLVYEEILSGGQLATSYYDNQTDKETFLLEDCEDKCSGKIIQYGVE